MTDNTHVKTDSKARVALYAKLRRHLIAIVYIIAELLHGISADEIKTHRD